MVSSSIAASTKADPVGSARLRHFRAACSSVAKACRSGRCDWEARVSSQKKTAAPRPSFISLARTCLRGSGDDLDDLSRTGVDQHDVFAPYKLLQRAVAAHHH